MKLVFATNNLHKLEEVQALLKNNIQLLSLADIGCREELPETGNTIEANAKQKAEYVFNKYHMACFADDTGLEIDALNGNPGVYSARYAGEEKSAEKNMEKVLVEMKKTISKTAKFKSIICLIIKNEYILFEGIVEGEILTNLKGKDGFGYDPIFQPKGYDKTFAEMTLEEKNKISHRAIAVKKLVAFLNEFKN